MDLASGVFRLGAAEEDDDEAPDEDEEEGEGDGEEDGADVGVDVDSGVGVEVDVVDDVADIAELPATGSAVFFVFVVRAGVLIVRLIADIALGLVLVLAFPAGLGVGRALAFSLDFRRLAWGLTFGWQAGEGVLRLDFMGWSGEVCGVWSSHCHSVTAARWS